MKKSYQRNILTGMALLAISSFTGTTTAQAANLTTASDATWASNGGQTGANVANAQAGDTLDITGDGATLTVTNNGIANDGSGDTNTFEIGDISDSSPAGTGNILISSGNEDELAVTMGEVTVGGTITFDSSNGDITVDAEIDGNGTTSAIIISGGHDVETSGEDWGDNTVLQTVTITGDGTQLKVKDDINAGLFIVGEGAELDVRDNIEGDVQLAGKLQLKGDKEIDGAITGSSGSTMEIQEEGGEVSGDISGLDEIEIDAEDDDTELKARGHVSATSIVLKEAETANTATLQMYSGKNLNAEVMADADGDGEIVIKIDGGITAINGNIGTSDKAVGTFILDDDGTEGTVTTTGNLYVKEITLGNNDKLQFIGTAQQTVSGIIDGDDSGEGWLTVGDGSNATNVIFASEIGGTNSVEALHVMENGTAIFMANATFDNDPMINDGTININAAATLTVDENYNENGESGTLNLGVSRTDGTTSSGSLVTIGGTVDLSNDSLNFTIEASQPLVEETITDIIVSGGGAATDPLTVADTSYMYDFAITPNGNNFDLEISQVNFISNTANSAANSHVGNALMTSLANSTNPEINMIQANVMAASSGAAVNDVLDASHATVDGGHLVTAQTVSAQVINLTGQRLAVLRTGNETGMAAGDSAQQGLGLWFQTFGQTAEQDERDNIAGYDTDTIGMTLGLDSGHKMDHSVIGAAYSFANTDVNSTNSNRTDTDVTSYQITLYGDYDMSDRMHLNGAFSYGVQDVETIRHNVGGVSGLTALGEFDAKQLVVQTELGYEMNSSDNLLLMPNLTAQYIHYTTDSYTETGAGGANLAVDSDAMDIFEIGLGLDISKKYQNGDGSFFIPALRLAARYDLVGDAVQSSSSFTGAPSTIFKTEGADPAQESFTIGAGVTYHTAGNWEIIANYDYELKEDYDSHAGVIRASFQF